MPNLDGIEAHAGSPPATDAARILILTTFDLDDYVYEALRAGASGFLLKDARADELSHAVRWSPPATRSSSPAITRRLIESYTRRPPPTAAPAALAELTPRELEVLRLARRGLSNAEIARDSSSATRPSRRTSHASSRNSTSATAPKPSSSPTKADSSSQAKPAPKPDTQRLTQRSPLCTFTVGVGREGCPSDRDALRRLETSH